jgi:hypothetical protein
MGSRELYLQGLEVDPGEGPLILFSTNSVAQIIEWRSEPPTKNMNVVHSK